MIPKTIHYIWLGGKAKPNIAGICINSWRKNLPHYTLKEWNENNLDLDRIASENRFFAECRKRKLWAFMADYLRLRILYEYGGIYLDTDIQVLKSFDNLLNDSCFIGMEPNNYIGTGVIACEKQDSTIKKVLKFYDDEIWNSELYTIPMIITKVLNDNPECKITIYPQDYFAPFDPYKGYSGKEETENTYCIHWFNAGWANNSGVVEFLAVKHIHNPVIRKLVVLRKRLGIAIRHSIHQGGKNNE